MAAQDEIFMMAYLLMRKRRNHQQRKQWSDKYFCCITRFHFLSLVVICYHHSLYHSLSLVITRCITFLYFYKRSLLYCFIKLKSLPKYCLFIHFQRVDVGKKKKKKKKIFRQSFFDLNNLMRMLRE